MNIFTVVLGELVELHDLAEERPVAIELAGRVYAGRARRYDVVRAHSRLPRLLAPWMPPGWLPRSLTSVQMNAGDELPGRSGPVSADEWIDTGDAAVFASLRDVEALMVQRHA